MKNCRLEITYSGLSSSGYVTIVRMVKTVPEKPRSLDIFTERDKFGQAETVLVKGWEKIDEKSEVVYRMKAIPDDRKKVSDIDRIAATFAAKGWDVNAQSITD